MYGIDELSGSITRYDFNIDTGKLIRRETVTTLPDNFNGENLCADLAITPDGRFLYVTTAATALPPIAGNGGLLEPIAITPSGGKSPKS